MQFTNLEHVKGDTFMQSVTFKSENTPINITGWTLKFTIKYAGVSGLPMATVNGAITNAVGWEVQFTIPATTMDDIPAGFYEYAIQYTTSGGVVKTPVIWSFSIIENVTL